jgi:hypothetical protein
VAKPQGNIIRFDLLLKGWPSASKYRVKSRTRLLRRELWTLLQHKHTVKGKPETPFMLGE